MKYKKGEKSCAHIKLMSFSCENMNTDVMFSSKTDQWATPQEFYNQLNEEFHFTLDPCADEFNHKCEKYFTEEDNGLSKDWGGEIVFCNPPYGKEIGKWCKKCYEESKKPNTTVVLLIPARTDTKYFHDYIYHKAELRFVKGRLKFSDSNNSAPFPSMVVIFSSDEKKIYQKFKYLDDLGIRVEDYGTNFISDGRNDFWSEQRDIYGFDERETWSLKDTFIEWIYTRVKMYKEFASNMINLEYHHFIFKGESYTQLQMIDMILEKCEAILKSEYIERDNDENIENQRDICDMWKEVLPAMWW